MYGVTNEILKDRAKDVLRRTYWMSFLVVIVVEIVSAISSVITSNYGLGARLVDFLLASPVISVLTLLALLVLIVLYNVFVINSFSIGIKRFFMLSRYNAVKFEEVLHGFKRTNYLNRVKILFLRDLYMLWWSLPSIISGIFIQNELFAFLLAILATIIGYRYFMIPYILAGNPAIKAKRAFEISRQTMNGAKYDLFILNLSFIGWIILGALTCGIGLIFLSPYIQATEAEFYAEMRQKAIQFGICTKDEIDADISEEIEAYEYAMQLNQRPFILEENHAPTKSCPLCNEQINIDQKFCHLCGCDVAEKKEEEKRIRLDELERNGIGALLDDQSIVEEAKMHRRYYGKLACVSFLKGKASELGLADAEMTQEDIDSLLEKLGMQ